MLLGSEVTVSLIIPCLWAEKSLYDMTKLCLDSVWDEKLQIIVIANNQPYAVNVNNALRAATGEILVVGNNDLIFTEGWLKGLLKPLEEGFDIATVWTSDQNVQLEDRIEEDAKFGSLFAMTREAYEKLGGFDEQFRGYFSDLDMRRRALDMGLKIGKNLNTVVGHESKSTYNKTDPKDSEYLRSKILYEIKHGVLE